MYIKYNFLFITDDIFTFALTLHLMTTYSWTVVLNRVTEIQDQYLIQYLLRTLVSCDIVNWQYNACSQTFDCLKYYTMIVFILYK
jgi:hypothetical protein